MQPTPPLHRASELGRRLAGLVAPPLCAACGRAEGGRDPAGLLCEGCRSELAGMTPVFEPGPPGMDALIAPWRFEGVARELLHSVKFGRRLGLASLAAAAIADAWHVLTALDANGAWVPAAERAQGSAALVPVPASVPRRLWRGFDPAEEVSIALARGLQMPLRRCLRRGHGPRQVGRPRAERLADPPRVRPHGPVPGHVLLVDDVCTTGATLTSCAAALRSAGCERVVALVAARALPSFAGHLPPAWGRRTIDAPSKGGRP